VDAAEEDCFVMSLVENLARRQHTPLELVRAIGALRERGYSHPEIAAKVDFSPEYVGAICFLLENGEEKLIKRCGARRHSAHHCYGDRAREGRRSPAGARPGL
jgi:ParB-like chromosome segregation protein Spo0J